MFFIGCQKEVSLELSGTVSSGSLQSNVTGECLPKTVQGIYEAGTVLNATTNYIDVQVNVTTIGTYRVYSDTVNGIFFQAKGTFATTGINNVRLLGNGTPLNAGLQNFVITYDTTECVVAVTILAQGGAVNAEYTFAGAPNECMNYVLAGDYVAGVPLTAANTVIINVNVTKAGTYTIATIVNNGIIFSGSGSFANTGTQPITLTANGSPGAAGSITIPVTFGASTCTFGVTVIATPNPSTDYFPTTAASNWSYQYDGDPDDSAYIRAKAGTITLGGNVYTVFEATIDAAGQGFGDYGAFRKAGSNYHTYIDLADYFIIDETTAPLDYIFLKDNVPANTTWNSGAVNVTFGGTPISVRIVLTVEQKDISATVNGTAYGNTIVVREKYEMSVIPGTWLDLTNQVGYSQSYYSRGIGLIKLDYHDPDGTANPPVSIQQDIRRYQVF